MQLDFWQLSRDPVEKVVALIAERSCAAGDRLLVVDGDDGRRKTIGQALWATKPEAFLANGEATEAHAARQPIVLSGECEAVNGAKYLVLSDGAWRDGAEGFERVFLLFGEAGAAAARATWRRFDGQEGVVRSYYAQEDGKWVKKA